MSDWAAVVLVLGLCALAVVVYAVREWRSMHVANDELRDLRALVEQQSGAVVSITGRVGKVEAVLRIDGSKAMAEANRNALPAMMR